MKRQWDDEAHLRRNVLKRGSPQRMQGIQVAAAAGMLRRRSTPITM
jgi:hypothetical protein